MEKRMTRARRGMLCAALIAATGTAGFAQYNRSVGGVQQVQPQGNALDASPQVGSGGSNTPVTGYVPINANNYVTGNVSGLGGFNQQQSVVNVNGVNVPVNNWNSGTQSPYTFRGAPLDQGSFANWIRTSSGGLQTSLGSANSAFYLPSSTVSTGQGSIYGQPYGSGFQSSMIPRSAISSLSGSDTTLMNGGVSIQQFSASPANVNQSSSYNSNLSSPLFAERIGNPAGNALGVDLGYNTVSQNNQAWRPSNVDPAAIRAGQVGTPINGMTNPAGDTPEEKRAREKLANPSDLSSVSLVDGRVNGQVSGRVQGQSNSVQNANVLPEGETIAARSQVNDTYKTLMGELEKAQAEAKEKEALAKANPNRAGKGAKGEAAAADNDGNKPAAASAPRNYAANGANGDNGPNGGPKQPEFAQVQSTDPTKPGYRPKSLKPMSIEETPTSDLQAGKNVPTVKTFGGGPGATATPFDQLMSKAEGMLKEGKYLDAANAYQTAMVQQPNNPLAILGRANAELGAGMYESAAGDLKFLFTRKPELISVKYALENYIPPQRQHQLIADLTQLSQNKGVGNTAEFLLCYLNYNTGRDVELQRELGRWDARPWKDSWQGVMKRAYGAGGE